MFSEEPVILTTENQNSDQSNNDDQTRSKKRKIIFLAFLVLGIIILVIIAFLIYKKYPPSKVAVIVNNPVVDSTSTQAILPDFSKPLNASSTEATTSFSNLVIEYLSFPDFYKSLDNNIVPKYIDYELPLNVKVDILNYPDISRKLNLDPGLESLSANGFALIDNPWEKENPGFYGAYENLETKQISPLITSDFIIYYFQNIFKKVFKDVEENVFYDNLWNINKDLYTSAKNRYETRLAAIGDVNDSILEGERLEMAYFAVSLQLLKPTVNQVSPKGVIDDKSKFASTEVDKFYFVLPPYLRDDVLREEKLIRDAKVKAKSPVLLYEQNYNDFTAPLEYKTNAKLNNFYLTTKWLNSVFPLIYRDKNCPNCLLDKEDWRINFIAASLISNDSANLPDLKNKWARIYKVMSFFKGLREDLNYIHYRDSLISVFGDSYDITQLFDDKNKFASANLEKIRVKLLSYELSEIQGAYNKKNQSQKPRVGFKMLAEPYWPNNYLFSNLSAPIVTNYLGSSPQEGNITSCFLGKINQRCNGVALDIINLATPIISNKYFSENTNYLNYSVKSDKIRAELNKTSVWQTSNYWSTLNVIKSYLNIDKNKQPMFARSNAWQSKSLNTASAAWINLQLPLEKYSVNQIFRGVGLNNYSGWGDNAYVEPNINLINELIANNTMVSKMMVALQLDKEISAASQSLSMANSSLNVLRNIVSKEIQGEDLNQDDKDAITDFAKQLKIEPGAASSKQLVTNFPAQKTLLRSDLSHIKLMVLIHQTANSKIISVGPIWDYRESR